jgi:hypothetical protein
MAKIRLLVLMIFAAGASCLIAAQSKQEEKEVTLEGTLVSSACYLGNPHHPTTNDMGDKKGCGTECLTHGDPAGFVTKDKQFHILVNSSLRLAPYVGQEMRITGTDYNGPIHVDKAEIKKDGKWEEVDIKYHAEKERAG